MLDERSSPVSRCDLGGDLSPQADPNIDNYQSTFEDKLEVAPPNAVFVGWESLQKAMARTSALSVAFLALGGLRFHSSQREPRYVPMTSVVKPCRS